MPVISGILLRCCSCCFFSPFWFWWVSTKLPVCRPSVVFLVLFLCIYLSHRRRFSHHPSNCSCASPFFSTNPLHGSVYRPTNQPTFLRKPHTWTWLGFVYKKKKTRVQVNNLRYLTMYIHTDIRTDGGTYISLLLCRISIKECIHDMHSSHTHAPLHSHTVRYIYYCVHQYVYLLSIRIRIVRDYLTQLI